MSGRTGLRRARVLLALTVDAQTTGRLANATGLKMAAVEGILDALSRHNLTDYVHGGWVISSGPHLDAALAEAQRLVDAQAQAVGA